MINTNGKLYLNWQDINDIVTEYLSNNQDILKDVKQIVAVSKGGFVPATMIANKLDIPVYALGIKSYNGMKQGEIEEYQPLPEGFIFKDTLIIDDVVDTGKTISYIIDKYDLDKRAKHIHFFALANVSDIDSIETYYSNLHSIYYGITEPGEWIVFPWEK